MTALVLALLLGQLRTSCPSGQAVTSVRGGFVRCAVIGLGMGSGHAKGYLECPDAKLVAVCDLDSRRMEDAKVLVNGVYAKKTGKPFDGVRGYLEPC